MTRTNSRFRANPALVVSFAALFIAMSGAAMALPGQNKVDSGDVNVVIDKVYPLSQAADAVAHMLEHHARGKVAIVA